MLTLILKKVRHCLKMNAETIVSLRFCRAGAVVSSHFSRAGASISLYFFSAVAIVSSHFCRAETIVSLYFFNPVLFKISNVIPILVSLPNFRALTISLGKLAGVLKFEHSFFTPLPFSSG